MAGWVRAGGGGIPSSLKSDMDAVLNKKFGTSTTYPPTGWPDDVNLMGPLPEKTASGAIASFSDGADDVPVKSAKFYFLPIQAAGTPSPSNPLAITGWTGLTATQTDGQTPPVESETYPVSWQASAGTIYGGYVDATRGKVVKTHESVNFNDQSLKWTYQNDYGRFLCQNLASYIVHASSNSTPLQGLYSESYQRDVAASSSAVNESISCSTLGYLFVYDSGYSDVNTWLGVVGNRKIIYPLQTPVEYDITAFIPSTYLGSNNFYSDANGDTEITYRADISLLLNSLQNNRGLMMMSIPEEQEETEEPEPESDER